jgi:hypothetical protein
MSRTLVHSKVDHCVELLLGLRHREVREALSQFGCTVETLTRGWELVSQVGLARAREERPSALPDDTRALVSELEKLQDLWFPIVRATLRGQFPELVAPFFASLARREGGMAPMSAGIFLERMRALARGAEPFGESGPLARVALEKRGFTAEVEGNIADLLAAWGRPSPSESADQDPRQAEEQAIAAMWSFYLEWRGIALSALTNPAHLRWLGLQEVHAASRGKAKRVNVEIRTQRPTPLDEPIFETQQVLRLKSKS